MRAAVYVRCSTSEQTTAGQLAELQQFAAARGWSAVVYSDEGISGARERRPALDALVADARRRRFDALVVWRLDRLGRSLRHLVNLAAELEALGVALVSLGEGIDGSTPSGRLQLHILAALAEFERERIRERVLSGLARVKRQGKRLGRPRRDGRRLAVTVRDAAKLWQVSTATAARRLRRGEVPQVTQSLSDGPSLSPDVSRLPMAAAGAETIG